MEILKAVLAVGGIGLVFGLLLAVASKFFSVEKDERLDKIVEALPGANCGGCGYAGCQNLAEAILSGNAPASGCPVGGSASSAKIAEIMGVSADEGVKMVASVLCTAKCGEDKFTYDGMEDCLAASLFGGGGKKSCTFACLGLGSCVKACQFGALSVASGVATVDEDKCTACGKCTKACPKNLISLVPKNRKVTVPCSSKDKGIVTKNTCETGCIACKLCEKNCPSEAISVVDNHAVIDYAKCTGCGVCAEKCPRKTIELRG